MLHVLPPGQRTYIMHTKTHLIILSGNVHHESRTFDPSYHATDLSYNHSCQLNHHICAPQESNLRLLVYISCYRSVIQLQLSVKPSHMCTTRVEPSTPRIYIMLQICSYNQYVRYTITCAQLSMTMTLTLTYVHTHTYIPGLTQIHSGYVYVV